MFYLKPITRAAVFLIILLLPASSPNLANALTASAAENIASSTGIPEKIPPAPLSTIEFIKENPGFINELNQMLSSDPTAPDSYPKLAALYEKAHGTDSAPEIVERILLSLLHKEAEINLLWKFWSTRNDSIESQQKLDQLPLFSPSFEFEDYCRSRSSSKPALPFPFVPRDLAIFARISLLLDHKPAAREAIARLTALGQEQYLGSDNAIYMLKTSSERPDFSQTLGRQQNAIATASILLFKPDLKNTGEVFINGYFRAGAAINTHDFRLLEKSVPADVFNFLFSQVVIAPPSSFTPEFTADDGCLLSLINTTGQEVFIFGQLREKRLSGVVYAMGNGLFKVIDSPEFFWAFNLLLHEIKIGDHTKTYEELKNARLLELKLGDKKPKQTFSETLQASGSIILDGRYFSMPPSATAPVIFDFYTWESNYKQDNTQLSFSFFGDGRKELPISSSDLLKAAKNLEQLLQASWGIKATNLCLFNLAENPGMISEPPEDRWLRAWSIRHGLPVGNELRKLLRLYKIIGAPLPDRISLRMPLLFRANLVNPRRPEGEYDMIGGYWFDELELLVIADFDTDTGSPLGRFAAESVGLKDDMAAADARIVLYDGFNFKNHGLRLAIPAANPAAEKITETLEKHQIKPAEDSMMLENPEDFRFFASISDRVYFILSEKDKPLQMRFAEEPEK